MFAEFLKRVAFGAVCVMLCTVILCSAALPSYGGRNEIRSIYGLSITANAAEDGVGGNDENKDMIDESEREAIRRAAEENPDGKAFDASAEGPSNSPAAIFLSVIFVLVCAALIADWILSAIKKHEKAKKERFSRE